MVLHERGERLVKKFQTWIIGKQERKKSIKEEVEEKRMFGIDGSRPRGETASFWPNLATKILYLGKVTGMTGREA